MDKTTIAERMKAYEDAFDVKMPARLPVLLRLDGKAFHTWTRKLNKPFDDSFINSMANLTLYLCKNIQTAQIGYVQSDEITIFLHPYKKLESQPYFNNRIQKLVSITASMASGWFNKNHSVNSTQLAFFDCRAFIVPPEDVCNAFLWRQQDATRNSIQGLGQANFSHKSLQNKSCNEIQEMLFSEKGINWNDLPAKYKRGICAIRNDENEWCLDFDIPVFSQNREYINRLLEKDDG